MCSVSHPDIEYHSVLNICQLVGTCQAAYDLLVIRKDDAQVLLEKHL